MTRYALEQLPPNLPEPQDDGACNHLLGKCLPDFSMDATNEQSVSLKNLKGKVVIFVIQEQVNQVCLLPRGGTKYLEPEGVLLKHVLSVTITKNYQI